MVHTQDERSQEQDESIEELKTLIDDIANVESKKKRVKVVPRGSLMYVRVEAVLEKPGLKTQPLVDRVVEAKKVLAEEGGDDLEDDIAWAHAQVSKQIRRATILNALSAVTVIFTAFIVALIFAAYAGFYIEPLRQFWYLWPVSGFAADMQKTGIILIVGGFIAVVFRSAAKRLQKKEKLEEKTPAKVLSTGEQTTGTPSPPKKSS